MPIESAYPGFGELVVSVFSQFIAPLSNAHGIIVVVLQMMQFLLSQGF